MDFISKTVGYVLSGGGSKGIAHAGVIKYLSEQNIEPFQIAGTSSGAIVAALYSWGKTPEEILTFFKSIYLFQWKHFTFTKAGIVDSLSFKKYFFDVFGDALIGDLKIPVHITATDMISGKLKIFLPNVKIADALLASSAFPGIISPYEIDGRTYSDGGILNHFPTDILSGRCENIIGVYVSPLEKINSSELTSIKKVTTRAFELLIANTNLHKHNLCDWVIQPKELSNYSTFETDRVNMEKIYRIGYESAKNAHIRLNL